MIPKFAAGAVLLATLCAGAPAAARGHSSRTKGELSELELQVAAHTVSQGWRLFGQRFFGAVSSSLPGSGLGAWLGALHAVAAVASKGDGLLASLLIARPADGELSSPFGVRRDPIHRRRKLHKGLDFYGDRGDPVRSAGDGVVVVARRRGGYGRAVFIDHGFGVRTRYAHLNRIKVTEGELVEAGTEVGTLGSSGRSTGPHLHFEVRLNGRPVDPFDAMADGVISEEPTWLVRVIDQFRGAPDDRGHRASL